MKKIFQFLILLAPLSSKGQSDVITRFFSQYEGRDDFTTVYITSKMFSLIAQLPEDENEGDFMNIVRRLTGIRILSAENYSNAEKLYSEAYPLLSRNGFDELMVVKNGNEEIKFMAWEKGDAISEFVMLIKDDEKFTLLSMTGNLNLKDISKLSKAMDIHGLEKYDDKAVKH